MAADGLAFGIERWLESLTVPLHGLGLMSTSTLRCVHAAPEGVAMLCSPTLSGGRCVLDTFPRQRELSSRTMTRTRDRKVRSLGSHALRPPSGAGDA